MILGNSQESRNGRECKVPMIAKNHQQELKHSESSPCKFMEQNSLNQGSFCHVKVFASPFS